MGISIGSLVEKVCDKLGMDEDLADTFGLAADAGVLLGCAYLLTPATLAAEAGGTAAKAVGAPIPTLGGTLKSSIGGALLSNSITGLLDGADDLVEEWGRDPLTASEWKDRIRQDGYKSFESALAEGQVGDAALQDAGLQGMRAEQEERQATVRSAEADRDRISAERAAAQRG